MGKVSKLNSKAFLKIILIDIVCIWRSLNDLNSNFFFNVSSNREIKDNSIYLSSFSFKASSFSISIEMLFNSDPSSIISPLICWVNPKRSPIKS